MHRAKSTGGNRKFFPILCLWLVLLLAGCAATGSAMVHPKTGDVQFCQDDRLGYILYAPSALIHIHTCIRQLESLGYVRAETRTLATAPAAQGLS